ncbi:recombinase RecD [Williamsia sp. Leaf354]|uniref:exodeoxyribonuclease V subunit alpha n=1 Tax=Williamsia sp. Leaf354 TaxID=1736349 RepID=UPI0006F81881|nr:exodeoxyribonuclease V subunit alpha [Williamsia sp. Leaf354]KQR98488.1 recombinase RecD [Williamsia sp. Leaf354]
MGTDARIAARAQGLLATFNAAGVLGVADVHVASRLAATSAVEIDPDVLLATALTVRAVRAGSVCIDLARLRDIPPDSETPGGRDPDGGDTGAIDALPWPDPTTLVEKVRNSPLNGSTTASPLQPLRCATTDDGVDLLYLDRYFRQEQRVRDVLAARAQIAPAVDLAAVTAHLDDLFPAATSGAGTGIDRQRLAAAVAATRPTTVLAGGPGTGKTHTAARIIALLSRLHGPGIRIGLCAPTGRAAASLQEAVVAQSVALDLPEVNAVTLHRLLGSTRRGSGRFRHDAGHRLPHDVVIVDEASMVSLTMMFHLLDALRPQTRLILIGDPDQLASVDAGAVLADLVHRRHDTPLDGPLAGIVDSVATPAEFDADEPDIADRAAIADGVISLRRRRRFGADIGRLADAVRDGDADTALDLLAAGSPSVTLVSPDDLDPVRGDVTAWVAAMSDAALDGDADAALAALGSHRVLCAHREGPAGVAVWARLVTAWSAPVATTGPDRLWYPGRPVLLTETDHRAQLYNGDTGVVVAEADRLMVAFGRGSLTRLVHPQRLRGVMSAHAMTIHRSQGSQYRSVSVVVPPAESALLTRELLYTAITRATDRVVLIGTPDGLRAGIERKVLRASGLRSSLTQT